MAALCLGASVGVFLNGIGAAIRGEYGWVAFDSALIAFNVTMVLWSLNP